MGINPYAMLFIAEAAVVGFLIAGLHGALLGVAVTLGVGLLLAGYSRGQH